MSEGLARLSVVKSILDITSSTNDVTLRNYIRTSTAAMEKETARNLISQSYTDEAYTATDRTKRLYLRQYPVTGTVTMKRGTSSVSANDFTVYSKSDAPYIVYDGEWSTVDSGILVSYTAGYDTTGWELLGENLDSGDSFNVPSDLEDAVAEYAAMLYLRSFKSGQARIGMVGVSRGGESLQYDKYVQGYPASFEATIQKYTRWYCG